MGIDYEYSVLESRNKDIDFILGSTFSINTITPNIYLNKIISQDGKTSLIWNIGLPIMFCSGEAEIDGFELTHNYNTVVFLRLGVSIEFADLLINNFGLGVGIRGYLGNQSRDKVDIKYNNESTYLSPIGSISLQDYTISPFIKIQYNIGL